jgi:hypothetical protein
MPGNISEYTFQVTAGYGLDGRGSMPSVDNIFLFTASRLALGPTWPPIQEISGALCMGAKQKEHDAVHN